jgi:predicted phosphodiesterase
MTRIALLSDIHGNAVALEAVRADIGKARPDAVLIAGDLVLNGPDPSGALDLVRAMESDGAIVVQGNPAVAAADFDSAAAFPWLTDGAPDAFAAAAAWAPDALADAGLDYLRRLPTERRIRAADGMLVLVCHASPGSQTAGFDRALDPNVTLERVSRTDARLVLCGHTHMPDVRDLGWKMIVNGGSAGYVFDGDPTASWALIDIHEGEITAELRRTAYDELSVANAISARGLPGDVYRAATVRTGKLVR